MRSGRWIALMSLLSLAVTAPLASAEDSMPVNAGADAAACAADGPPCGFITPLLDLILPTKPACGGGAALGQAMDPSDCLAPPTADTPIVLEGEFRLYWQISEDLTYLNDVNDPIVVTFSSTNRNPSFIDFSIEPSSFTLDTQTLFSPEYIKTVDNGGTTQIWYDYRQPVTLTFSRNGEPSTDDRESIANQDGVAQFYVKMQSDESGERFKPGWGIEPVRFHMDNDPTFKATPTPGLAAIVGSLGVAVMVARRR